MHIKIVFSGGPGVGKTSILRVLQQRLFTVKTEVFTEIFRPAAEAGCLLELFQDGGPLLDRLFDKQKAQEEDPAPHEVFYDRGMVDIAVFAQNEGYVLTPEHRRSVEESMYDAAVLIEPLPRHLYEQNICRRQDYATALHDHERLCEAYQRHVSDTGHGVLLQVPPMLHGGPEKRADFILDQLNIPRKSLEA